MMLAFKVVVSCAVGLLALGCGGDDTGGSTTSSGASSGGGGSSGATVTACDSSAKNQQCYERSTTSEEAIDMFTSSCKDVLEGTIVDRCPPGSVGGCKVTELNGTTIVWQYPPDTKDDVTCGTSAEFVPPAD